MKNKTIWIIAGIIAVLIPLILVLCFGIYFNGIEPEEQTAVTTTENGGTVTGPDSKGICTFSSKYGYSVQYRGEYEPDFSQSQYDFYVSDDKKTVQSAISVSKKDGTFDDITSKEEWDAKMTKFGTSADFKITDINGSDAIVAHYYANDDSGTNGADIIIAVIRGETYYYTYYYIASAAADETTANHMGAVLMTFIEKAE